jgi:hypothetical protein
MPAFVASAVFAPRCPGRSSLIVCAALALSPLIPVGIAAGRIDFSHRPDHSAQPVMADVSPRVGFGTASAPTQAMYTPVTRGAASSDAESFGFYK